MKCDNQTNKCIKQHEFASHADKAYKQDNLLPLKERKMKNEFNQNSKIKPVITALKTNVMIKIAAKYCVSTLRLVKTRNVFKKVKRRWIKNITQG